MLIFIITILKNMSQKIHRRLLCGIHLMMKLVALENTLLFVQAMYRHNVPVEYHVFHTGRHGLSMCTEEVGERGAEHCAHWFSLCAEWLDCLFDWKK